MRSTIRASVRAAGAAALALLLLAGPTAAQEGASDSSPRTMTPDDYGKFERLGRSTLSDDGRWLAVEILRVNEENELRARALANPDSVVVVPYGTSAAFSSDGRWLGVSRGVSSDERERLQKAKKPVHDDLVLVDLSDGSRTEVEDVASFAFSADGHFLAMRRYPPQGDRDAKGVDLVVRDLSSGVETAFGNVSEYAWADQGTLLAMTVDAQEMAGNGVQLFDAGSGRLTTLDSHDTRYSGLRWRDDANDLAVMRQMPRDDDGEKAWADTAQVVLAWTGIRSGTRPATHLLSAATGGFPDSTRIVSFQPLRWSEEGDMVFVGLDAREVAPPKCEPEGEGEAADEAEEGGDMEGQEAPAPDAEACEKVDEDDKPTVEVWHAKDVDIVPTQKVQANRDRRENDLAAWHVAGNRLVRLEDDLTEDVTILPDADVAIGSDATPYEADRMFGPAYRDVYLVDLDSGEKTRALEQVEFFLGASPSGRYLIWVQDDDVWSWDARDGTTTNLTGDLPTSFVDVDDDHTVDQKPPYGVGGWLEDDEAVLLYDKLDVWQVAPDGSDARQLTHGADANVRYRRVRLDFDERAIDPDEPQYFSMYDDWAEEWGYGRSNDLGGDVQRLVWGPQSYGGLTKAEDADVYLYQEQDFDDSPDYFVTGPRLRNPRQVTKTNPFQDDYLWGHTELITYQNTYGDTLQGALYYPAGYEPGRKYPMITYIYEILSNGVRRYYTPSERDYYNLQSWVQHGYFVFQPDIVYKDRDPGVSAVAALEPAVAAVVAKGDVDPERVGLVGHSWGGYQTTFTVTQTDIFAAAVAGAPLTNLFSMYLSVYWNSGGTDARIFEISQGRMEVPFWEDEAAYERNSPVFHIEDLHTPFLMAQGSEDGAVDFNQGVEFYNAARRAGKDFVFLVYNGENHGFSQEPNQKDYHRRIMEWFGHYLKGDPAPDWMTQGVPYLEQAEETRTSRGGG